MRIGALSRITTILSSGLLLLIVALPGLAGDGDAKADKAAKGDVSSTVAAAAAASRARAGAAEATVYTNESLKKMFANSPEPWATEPSPPAESEATSASVADPKEGEAIDPLQAMKQQAIDRSEREIELADVRAAVRDAGKRVADLEKRLLAVKNPLLARPEKPEDDDGRWERANGTERVKMTEEALALAQEELSEQRHRLTELQRGS